MSEKKRHAHSYVRVADAKRQSNRFREMKPSTRVEHRDDGAFAAPGAEKNRRSRLAEHRPVGRKPEVPLHDHRNREVVGSTDGIDIEAEADADAIVDRAYETVENERYRSSEADARTIVRVTESVPAEKKVRLGLEEVVRVLAWLLDDRLLGSVLSD